MTSNPPPRPALRKASDAAVHPAAARLVPVAAQVPPKPKAGGKGKAKVKDAPADLSPVDPKDAKSVELVVALPKAMRKRLKVKAKEHGYSAEEVTYQLVKAWLEGR